MNSHARKLEAAALGAGIRAQLLLSPLAARWKSAPQLPDACLPWTIFHAAPNQAGAESEA